MNNTPVKHQRRVAPVNDTPLEYPLWKDKRCPFFGLPLSFTTYTLLSDRLIIESGILTKRREEIRLYRILDITMNQTLFQRLFAVGTLKVSTVDASARKCYIRDIPTPVEVMELLSDMSNRERQTLGCALTEFLHFDL